MRFVTGWLLALAIIVCSATSLEAARPRPKAKPARKTPAQRFAMLDVNKDAKLSPEEFSAKKTGDAQVKAEKHFQKIDKDSDGFLTVDELLASIKKKSSQ